MMRNDVYDRVLKLLKTRRRAFLKVVNSYGHHIRDRVIYKDGDVCWMSVEYPKDGWYQSCFAFDCFDAVSALSQMRSYDSKLGFKVTIHRNQKRRVTRPKD